MKKYSNLETKSVLKFSLAETALLVAAIASTSFSASADYASSCSQCHGTTAANSNRRGTSAAQIKSAISRVSDMGKLKSLSNAELNGIASELGGAANLDVANPTPTENQPPQLDSILTYTVTVGPPLKFTISASDMDGDKLKFTANKPKGASLQKVRFDGAQGKWLADFAWKPKTTQAGNSYTVIFKVCEKKNATHCDEGNTVITVNNP